MKFEMMELPFDRDAMEPFLSHKTIDFHFDKHHAGYLKKLDKALDNELRDQSLADIVKQTSGKLFNLAAQVWNHNFYWQSLAADSQEPGDPQLIQKIDDSFGGLKGFEAAFADAAANEFGSGWAWLLLDPKSGELSITSTTDAINPLTMGMTPLLTLDVWEHAYYLDYQNRRGDYIREFLSEHLNWRFVEANLASA